MTERGDRDHRRIDRIDVKKYVDLIMGGQNNHQHSCRCSLMPTFTTPQLAIDFEATWQTSEWWQWPTYSLKRGAIVP